MPAGLLAGRNTATTSTNAGELPGLEVLTNVKVGTFLGKAQHLHQSYKSYKSHNSNVWGQHVLRFKIVRYV